MKKRLFYGGIALVVICFIIGSYIFGYNKGLIGGHTSKVQSTFSHGVISIAQHKPQIATHAVFTNEAFIYFISNYYMLIILIFIFLFLSSARIIPPTWAGFYKYNGINDPSKGEAPKITLLRLVLHNIIDGILPSFILPVIALFEFKKLITVVILVVVATNIIYSQQISTASITLISIGILTLYLERLIETGKHIKVFGLITWDKEDNTPGQTPPPPSQ